MADLQESIRSFYFGEKEREDRELAQIALRGAPVDKADGQMLIRLGRHSGAESVTIEGYRRIRIMKGKGQQAGTLDRSTTFWLASDQRKPTTIRGFRPFGWSLMRELTTELEEQLQE
jgi:CRISPR-associated protein Csm5